MTKLQRLAAEGEVQLLLLIVTASFLISVPLRLWALRNKSQKAATSTFGWVKALISLLLPLFQIARLVEYAGWPTTQGFINAVTPVASVVAAFGYCILSPIEHRRSIRPSTPIQLFLAASLICDATLWALVALNDGRMRSHTIPAAATLLDFLLLLVESRDKCGILLEHHSASSPRDVVGVLSNTFFWWINPILAKGYRTLLVDENLPGLDSDLSSAGLRAISLQRWAQRRKPETSMTLPLVVLRTLLRPFLGAVLPRLFLTLFTYSQPLLIREAIRFLALSNREIEFVDSFNIIAAAVIIYTGLAISNAVYELCLKRLTVMTRGVLVNLIHHKTLNTASDILHDGKVVTLMSNDVDSLSGVAGMFHETWAQVLEVAIGITLLASEVGWLWPLPLVFIFFCSRVSQYVARNLRSRQGAWNAATQDRISMTSAVLSTIKNVKMLGLQDSMISYVKRLRHSELMVAGKVRWMMVIYNASANALGMFAPMLTLVIYAIIAGARGSSLDTETAFTTTAILGMVTHPANMVMTIVPRAIAAFSSFERIQNFLLEPDLLETRNENPISSPGSAGPAVAFKQVSVETSSSKTLLQDVTFEMPRGTLTICAGPTASGKTTLAKTILGEVVASRGSISMSSTNIGYCAQTAWLPSTTIKEAIVSFSRGAEIDEVWYNEVLRLCCLQSDLETMPNGDRTLVGSRGMNLSGGQKQRVSLARSIYARPDIFVLDDTLSGLDGKTENQVVENLFGPDGLVRKLGATVFLITNAAQHFHLADRILILEDSRIKEQGNWNELKSEQHQIEKMLTKSEETSAQDSEAGGLTQKPATRVQTVPKKQVNIRRTNGDNALYSYYIRSAGYGNFSLMVTCTILTSVFMTLPQYWLKIWTDSGSAANSFYMAGFVLITTIAWCSTNGIMWSTVLRIAPHSGLVLHSTLLETILKAPLAYFSRTETGEILNRFSQDMQLVDKQLAPAIQTLSVQIFKLTVQVVLLLLASKYMTFTLPVCFVIVYIVQKVYLRTSRQLRILELESRSAVFSSFLETVEGVTTIRAFQGREQAEANHLKYLDISQRPFYLLFCLQRWLNIVLDLLVAAIAVGVIILAVILRGTTTGGQIGLALNMILVANGTLLKLVQSWTNLEISLGAMTRFKSLEEEVLPEDNDADMITSQLSSPWPEPGVVELKSLTAAYNPQVVALRNFSLRVNSGQLAVLCGRTGRGKSSVLLALLKMMDVREGSIMVHGFNTMHIPSSVIREKFFVTIPQDAILFSQATLRFNLDPSEALGNETIENVLQKVQLWRHFQAFDSDNGDTPKPDQIQIQGSSHPVFDRKLSTLGQLSAGQAQLLALGRALLQAHSIAEGGYKPIILLDEATSSLDNDTESLMLSIVHEEFMLKGYTVIMIAHRLGAVKALMREGTDKMVEM